MLFQAPKGVLELRTCHSQAWADFRVGIAETLGQ